MSQLKKIIVYQPKRADNIKNEHYIYRYIEHPYYIFVCILCIKICCVFLYKFTEEYFKFLLLVVVFLNESVPLGKKPPDVQWFTDRMENLLFLSSAHSARRAVSLSVCRLSDIAPQVANLREMAPQRPALALQPHSYSITLTWDQSDIQTAGTRACVLTLVPCLFTLRQNASVPQFRSVCVCVCVACHFRLYSKSASTNELRRQTAQLLRSQQDHLNADNGSAWKSASLTRACGHTTFTLHTRQ